MGEVKYQLRIINYEFWDWEMLKTRQV